MGEWTVGTLKEHMDQRFGDLDQRTKDAKHSMERAEDAATATRAYAEQKTNEFRGQLEDQAKMFMPRSEAQVGLDELRRLVYTASGIAIAAGIAIPLLLR